MIDELSISDIGLDWVTLSGEHAGEMHAVLKGAIDWIDRLAVQYGEIEDWKKLGYEGMKCGPLALGSRSDDRFLIVVSGNEANQVPDNIENISNLKPTRIDYQVTVKLARARDLASELYDIVETSNRLSERKKTIQYIKSDTGSTFYLNKRNSPVFIRVYDKSQAYGHPLGTCWRYEVEYKKGHALPAFARWMKSPNRTTTIASTVASELTTRGIITQFGSGAGTRISVTQEPSTFAKKLRWLESCVRPVVGKLITGGFEDEALEALGLSDKNELDNLLKLL